MRFLISLSLFALPLWATSFTAITSSEGGGACSNVSLPSPTSCRTGSGDGVNGGVVTAIAGFEPPLPGGTGFMAMAEVDLAAVCFGPVAQCPTQFGMADAELDLAIHGEPPGTPGLLEITTITDGGFGFVNATPHVMGLTTSFVLGPHGGFLYNFFYGQPFLISAIANGECSECGSFFSPIVGSAEFLTPFYVYDTNMNLLGTINTPLDAQPAPEPITVTIMIAGLAFILHAARHKTRMEEVRQIS